METSEIPLDQPLDEVMSIHRHRSLWIPLYNLVTKNSCVPTETIHIKIYFI